MTVATVHTAVSPRAEARTSAPAAVRLENISKTYPGSRVAAVSRLSLDVPEGEIFTLLGPSGCGKSTTLRIIAGLEEPDAGVIRFGDKVIVDTTRGIMLPPERRDIGMVFQPRREVAEEPAAADQDEILSWAYARRLGADTLRLVSAPLRWDRTGWLLAGGIAAAVGGSMLLDHEVRSIAQHNQTNAGQDAADVLKYFGHAVPAGIIGLSYLGGEITG
ncbi:MAG: ATP-binding cassette domain-containing protein, partial [Gemmatimonas sp.]